MENTNQFNGSIEPSSMPSSVAPHPGYYTEEDVYNVKSERVANVFANIDKLIKSTFVIVDKAHPKALQSFGQSAVSVSFNPSKDSDVDFAKELLALSIDLMRKHVTKGGGKARHANTAITQLETAQMRMVKAITWDGE